MPVAFYDELAALVNKVADRVDRWTGHAARMFEPGSPASAEVANTEVKQDGSAWGDRPVRTVYAYAQMETKLTVELSRCAAALRAWSSGQPVVHSRSDPSRSVPALSSWQPWPTDPGCGSSEEGAVPTARILRPANAPTGHR